MVTLPASDKRLDEIRRELKKDDTLKVVMQYVQDGWPTDKRKMYGPVRKYWSEKGNLSIHDNLLLRGRRLVIPEVLRPNILSYLHDAHQGITKTRENAASSVWWPGLSREIENMVKNCNTCSKYRRERIEPMKGTPFPVRPWSNVEADFFQHKGHNYLLVVDYYSRDVEICLVTQRVNTAETVLKMKKVFSRHGICDTLHSDNGPQFGSDDFKQFADQWGFEHVTSSPLYVQSNGEVERAVQTMKAKLNKCDDEYLALLSYRDNPLHNGYSPAQLSMGRKLRSRVPCHPDELLPRIPDYDELCRHKRRYREKMEQNYNHRHSRGGWATLFWRSRLDTRTAYRRVSGETPWHAKVSGSTNAKKYGEKKPAYDSETAKPTRHWANSKHQRTIAPLSCDCTCHACDFIRWWAWSSNPRSSSRAVCGTWGESRTRHNDGATTFWATTQAAQEIYWGVLIWGNPRVQIIYGHC